PLALSPPIVCHAALVAAAAKSSASSAVALDTIARRSQLGGSSSRWRVTAQPSESGSAIEASASPDAHAGAATCGRTKKNRGPAPAVANPASAARARVRSTGVSRRPGNAHAATRIDRAGEEARGEGDALDGVDGRGLVEAELRDQRRDRPESVRNGGER